MAAPTFLTLLNGVFKQVSAAVTATANAVVGTNSSGQIDSSFLPAGLGVDTVVATASGSIAAGSFVNLYDNAGTLTCRLADGSTTGKEANGFAPTSITSSATGTITLEGQNAALTGLTDGAYYWLSNATPGAPITPAPTYTSGQTCQLLGKALGTTTIDFHVQSFTQT